MRIYAMLSIVAFALILSIPNVLAFCNGAYSYRYPIVNTDDYASPFLVNDTAGINFGDGTQYIWCNSTANYLCYSGTSSYDCYNDDVKLPMDIDKGNGTRYDDPYGVSNVFTYHQNDTSGYDSSIYGNHITAVTGTLTLGDGVIGKAVDYNAANDRAKSSAHADLTTSLQTVMFWFNADAVNNVYCMFTDYDENEIDSLDGWGICFNSNPISIFVRSGGAATYYNVGGTQPTGTWQHVTVEINTTHFKIWMNGTAMNDWTAHAAAGGNSVPVTLGAFDYKNGYNDFDGLLDEVRLYNRSLSDAEIMAIYLNQNGTGNYSYILASETAATGAPEWANVSVSPASGNEYPITSIDFNITWVNTTNTSWIVHNFTGTSQKIYMTNVSQLYNYSLYTPLSAGAYQYQFYANSSTGATNNTDVLYYIINKSTAANTTLSASPGFSGSEDTEVTVTCSVDASLTASLTRDGVTVSNPDVVTLSFGNYVYNCTITDTENYTATYAVNTLVIASGGFGCTDNETYAFEINLSVTPGDTNITLDFSSLIDEHILSPTMGDVLPFTNTSPRGWVNITNGYFIANTTGMNFISINFGNMAFDFNWSGLSNTTDAQTFTYNEINPYLKLSFVDERSGSVQLPPDSNRTLFIICDSGISNVNISNERMLIATFETAEEIKAQVQYSVTEIYFRNYLISSAVSVMNVYLVDANIDQVVEIIFTLEDATSDFLNSIFRVKKPIEGSQRTITEQYFDAEKKSIVYLINGDRYNLFVDNLEEERSIGFLYVDSVDLDKTIKLGEILVTNQTEGNISYGLFNTTDTIVFSFIDASGQTSSAEFWIYNATDGTELYYSNSTNRSRIQFTYLVPDTNQTYHVRVRVHHNTFGLNTIALDAPFFMPMFTIPNPFEPLSGIFGDIPYGISWENLLGMIVVIGVAMMFTISSGAIAGIVAVIVAAILAFIGWWTADVIMLAVALVIGVLNKLTEKKRET